MLILTDGIISVFWVKLNLIYKLLRAEIACYQYAGFKLKVRHAEVLPSCFTQLVSYHKFNSSRKLTKGDISNLGWRISIKNLIVVCFNDYYLSIIYNDFSPTFMTDRESNCFILYGKLLLQDT